MGGRSVDNAGKLEVEDGEKQTGLYKPEIQAEVSDSRRSRSGSQP